MIKKAYDRHEQRSKADQGSQDNSRSEESRSIHSNGSKESNQTAKRAQLKKNNLKPLFLSKEIQPSVNEAIVIQSSSQKSSQNARDYILV